MNRARLLSLVSVVLGLVAAPAFAGRAFVFPLGGYQETPPVNSEANGSCVAILSGDEAELDIHCTHDVSGAIAAHIHIGPPGVAGPIVFPLTPGNPIQATLTLSPTNVADLLAGNYYVNVHTPANPGGEIRGQMTLERDLDFEVMRVALVGTSGVSAGTCVVFFAESTSELEVICPHGVGDATDAQLRLGAPDSGGTVIADLGTGASPVRGIVTLSASEVAALREGNVFVLVSSPSGDRRAQLSGCFADDTTLCLLGGRYEVQASWATLTGNGVAHALPATPDSGHFWFFTPNNLELTVKVLHGCPVNDRVWVFAAGLTDVGVTLRVRDTVTDTVNTYTDPPGQAFQPITDTRAFDTCP